MLGCRCNRKPPKSFLFKKEYENTIKNGCLNLKALKNKICRWKPEPHFSDN